MFLVSGSSRIFGSTKNTTGICTSWPGDSLCSVKQKHWILVKYWPAWTGVTLKVAVPVTGRSARLRAVNKAMLRAPIATLRWGATGADRHGKAEEGVASERTQ